MKKVANYILIVFVIAFISCSQKNEQLKIKSITVEAPFEMPPITIPDFEACKEFNILEFGAEPDNQEKTSMAINKAIDKSNEIGGGKVIIPAGEWLLSKIHFKSNVNLHLEKGAVLLFSDNPNDYLPAVPSTWEGLECYNYSPLIYAYKCKNIAITGEGILKPKMDVWKVWFERPPSHMRNTVRLYNMGAKGVPLEERQMANDSARFRPHFIQFNRCENVLMDGVSVQNSPFWTIHPFMSKNVVIRNVKEYAHGHNNDGIDPEMSQNVLIENCVFDQGDDAIAVKSGRNQDAWRLNTPTKNLVIRNCTVKNGHQLLAIGSELSGGIENVYMTDCIIADSADVRNLVYIKTNERRGGYVKNIHVNNIKIGKISSGIVEIDTDVLYQWRDLVPTYERRLTEIKDVFIENIDAENVQFISKINGTEELPVENVILTNVNVNTVREQKIQNKNVRDFEIKRSLKSLPEEAQKEWKQMHQNKKQRLKEFNDAKFGMFIHWGLYSKPAGIWKGKKIEGLGEWIMYKAQIPRAEYRAIAKDFNPEKFNAEEWVGYAKQAGMKYIVAMPKHHDGFAMYDSKVSDYDIVDATPFGRDPMAELYNECKKQGLKFGIYYSHSIDWMDGGDAGVAQGLKEYPNSTNTYAANLWDPSSISYDEYQEKKAKPQMRELLEIFPDLFEIWYDFPRLMNEEQSFSFYKLVSEKQPECIINSRVGNGMGDFWIPGDNCIPADGEGEDICWETPGTLNNTWGIKSYDTDWKSIDELLYWITEITSKGGNYLLNVGPTAEGLFPEESIKQLKEIGEWMSINGEAVYGTTKWKVSHEGPYDAEMKSTGSRAENGFDTGFTSEDLWFTQKGENLYAISLVSPEGKLTIKSLSEIADQIKSIEVLGSNEELSWETDNNGVVVSIPDSLKDKAKYKHGFVLKVKQ